MGKIGHKVHRAKKSITEEGLNVFSYKLARYVRWRGGLLVERGTSKLPAKLKYANQSYSDEYIFLSNEIFNINENDIKKSKYIVKSHRKIDVKRATWFVPYFNHLAFGGIFTIFRFINFMAEKGVECNIVIYDRPSVDAAALKKEIVAKFPKLDSANLILFDPAIDNIDELPSSDIAFCTFWVSAYYLLRYNQTKRKYYFIQDYEPLFYEGGSTYALAESTYRFGFRGVVNTPGLLKAVNNRHGLEGISFTPAVDNRYYYAKKSQKTNDKIKIFFYARPANPRNAFFLGVQIIKQLVEKYGDKIEVVTAGADWNEAKFGLKGHIINLGLLNSLDEVGNLYRSCDIGFVYMLSKHPSYQPFEFMATGVATVTNNNEDNLWMLKDGVNCLVAEPSPGAMAEKIGWLIEDDYLRKKIQEGGYETVSNDWQKQLDIIWNDIRNS